jgi:DNA damage-binding protein 1
MTLELFDGVVTVIPLTEEAIPSKKGKKSAATQRTNTLGEPSQVRIEELQTRASAFLQTPADATANPRLAILWEDNDENPQLKLRELKYTDGESPNCELDTVAELRAELDPGVSHLIPVTGSLGGFLLLGENSISYVDSDLRVIKSETLPQSQTTIWSAWTQVDDSRFLLGDDYGSLYFLMLLLQEEAGESYYAWQLDPIGQASRASCLVYLDEGLVYVGSHTGDSQIVEIREGGVLIQQTFENIGPILDFTITDLGRGAETSQAGDFSSGQARILTASGAWQDGTIRSVRSGVGMDVIGTIAEIPSITELWGISSGGDLGVQDTLVVTSVDDTRILQFDLSGNLEELESFGAFDLSQQTMLAANLPDGRVVQVHETGVVVSQLQSNMQMSGWQPSSGAKLTAAATNAVHLLVVEGGHTLHVFHPSSDQEQPTASKNFGSDSQISSVTVPETQSNVCIVSFWQTASVAILDLHSLEPLYTQTLGEPGVAIPRSVVVANLLPDSSPTLLVAMADGTVATFTFDLAQNSLTGMSRIILGTEPVHFKRLPRSNEGEGKLSNIFASCEQSSLIYAAEGRIVYSAVSADQVTRVCTLNSASYPGAVAIAAGEDLKLAMIGRERTTQIQTLPVTETIRCLAYDRKARLFGVGCIDRGLERGQEFLTSRIKLANEVHFQTIDEMELRDQELVECIISTGEFETDEDDFGEMFVVGTSINPDHDAMEESSIRGRLIVLEVTREKKIKQVCEQEVKGAVRSLAMCQGKIVAGLVKAVSRVAADNETLY